MSMSDAVAPSGFADRKAWLEVHDIISPHEILAMVAGEAAYRGEFNRIVQKEFDKKE